MGFLKKAAGAVSGAVKSIASPAGLVNPFVAGQIGAAKGAGVGGLSSKDQMKIPGIGLSEEARSAARMKDIGQGRAFGQELVADHSLGRIGNNADVKSSMDVIRGQLGGFTAPELQGQRDIATAGINRSTELARRRLGAAQARAGVRGATAATQQAGVIQEGIQQTSDFERNLMLGQRAEQSRAAQSLLGSASEIGKFDMSQKARERFAQLSTGLGFAQIGSAERAGKLGADASVAAAQAQTPSGGLLGGVLGK